MVGHEKTCRKPRNTATEGITKCLMQHQTLRFLWENPCSARASWSLPLNWVSWQTALKQFGRTTDEHGWQTVLVTGATGGIGKATALELARQSANVCIRPCQAACGNGCDRQRIASWFGWNGFWQQCQERPLARSGSNGQSLCHVTPKGCRDKRLPRFEQ